MGIKVTINKGKVPVKIWTNDIEKTAFDQLINLSKLDIMKYPIAAMPDVHAGIGATVGSVIPTINAIIPAAVGVDIGCGMNAIKLSLHANQLPYSLNKIRTAIEKAIPLGHARHKINSTHIEQNKNKISDMEKGLTIILDKHEKLVKMQHNLNKTWICQLGTLGGGNHFIEICLDESNMVWVMLHSGSRGIGHAIGSYFINKARHDMGKHYYSLPDKDLAYLSEGSYLFNDYIYALNWAQNYAFENRMMMMNFIINAIKPLLPEFTITNEAINCHHNYVAIENHFGKQMYITRKGAISAKNGEMGIIPGSMGAKSYIVRGLGNNQSYHSCSHGAGRKMSRKKAREIFNREDLINQTKGVECRKDNRVIDEIPHAYKNIDEVMDNQKDLVEIIHTLKQVICVKG